MMIICDATTCDISNDNYSDDPRGVIYDRNILIIQAILANPLKHLFFSLIERTKQDFSQIFLVRPEPA